MLCVFSAKKRHAASNESWISHGLRRSPALRLYFVLAFSYAMTGSTVLHPSGTGLRQSGTVMGDSKSQFETNAAEHLAANIWGPSCGAEFEKTRQC